MTEREKVVAAVECCFHLGSKGCQSCPYVSEVDLEHGCTVDLAGRIIAQLKAPEARVMTLKELRDVGRVWESSAPPYLWLDKNRSIYNTISFWCAWRDIYEMINGRHDKYTDENYGSEWRCWTARPTEEQRKAVLWDG